MGGWHWFRPLHTHDLVAKRGSVSVHEFLPPIYPRNVPYRCTSVHFWDGRQHHCVSASSSASASDSNTMSARV
ncbi:hypothetical protein C8039_14370 [Halogeometricum sp. wsp3]|nr:hypothetical protein C8039_14370 [Halogeometricum sp. wsp3]